MSCGTFARGWTRNGESCAYYSMILRLCVDRDR
jgi:hypothetical protein